jgi:hypothetical protein
MVLINIAHKWNEFEKERVTGSRREFKQEDINIDKA